jgi:hypothetical protein
MGLMGTSISGGGSYLTGVDPSGCGGGGAGVFALLAGGGFGGGATVGRSSVLVLASTLFAGSAFGGGAAMGLSWCAGPCCTFGGG